MYKSILFVCEANKCRSAMAEFLLKHLLQEQGMDGQIQVRSGGIAYYARDGALISQDAEILLKNDGVSVSDEFRTTDLKQHSELLTEADLLLTMTSDQLERLAGFPEAEGKEAHTLKSFVGETGDIEDPEGQEDDQAYTECWTQVKKCLRKSVDRICSPHP